MIDDRYDCNAELSNATNAQLTKTHRTALQRSGYRTGISKRDGINAESICRTISILDFHSK